MTAPLAVAVEPAASPPQDGAPVLDPLVLARLDELDPAGSNGLVRRVLQTFVGSLERMREQMLVGREDADQAVLRYVAHTLKSSAGSVGALALSQRCADTERRVREGAYAEPARRAELDADIQCLLDDIDRARLAVLRRLAT